METKPYSIQSPESIAKDYGGNKQKIAQAMQLGIIDPTAGVLAGMFIDRMRSAQMQEMTQPQTVAQQVMGGAPTTPPPVSPTAGGLGATPQGTPPMAPPMGAPAPTPTPPPQAPMGMADGGLAALPISDDMFDEPDNGSYAGGGIVAFAEGGYDPDAFRRAIREQESGGDYGILNAQGSGAMGAYQFMPDTARALARRLGLPYRPELMTGAGGRSKEGRAYQERLMDAQMEDINRFSGGDPRAAAAYHFAGPNRAGWKGKTAQYQSDIQRRMGMPSESTAPTAGGLGATAPWGGGETLEASYPRLVEQGLGMFDKYMPEPKREARELYREEVRREFDPAMLKKQADDDKWMTLAQIGFNMASSNSPYFLQALGAAAAAALPGAKADKKEREARKREALRAYADLEGMDNKEAREKVMFGLEYAKDVAGLRRDDIARAFEQNKTIFQEAGDTERTRMSVEGRIREQEISNAGSGMGGFGKPLSPTAADSIMQRATKQMENAVKAMNAADLKKDFGAVTRASKQYTDAFNAYNKAATDIGLPPMSEAETVNTPNYQKFSRERRAKQGADAGQGRVVSQGIIRNAQPIP